MARIGYARLSTRDQNPEAQTDRLRLIVPRVDFLRRKVQVRSQAQRGQLDAELKTDASTRTIPADEWVLNEISAHIQQFGTGVDKVIVTNRVGRVAQRNAFGTCWRNAVADARTCGKPPAQEQQGGECGEKTCADPAYCLPKGSRFHDLRHFYASTLIAANLNPKVIQARLGRATITETMDTYTLSRKPAPGPVRRSTARSREPGQPPSATGTAHVHPVCTGVAPTAHRRWSEAQKGVSRPVGRVLCARLRGPTVIHLGLPLPAASCGLPASIGRAALERSRRPAA